MFPAHCASLDALRARGKDLLVLFRSGWHYEPAMGLNNVIRSVLPSLAPELTYLGLNIADGENARRHFAEISRETWKRSAPTC
jgi:hypothetical protein